MIHVGVIGAGYWGAKIIRNLASIPYVTIAYICDVSESNLVPYKETYKCTQSYTDILKDDAVDAVFVITPISTHYTIVCDCIRNKKHVFVEKPLCKTRDELDTVYKLADSHGVSVMCDYTFMFSNKIDTLQQLIKKEDIMYIEMNRLDFALNWSDSIIYDFIPHDISVLNKLFDSSDIEILFCNNVSHSGRIIKSGIQFRIDNIPGYINVSWLNNTKDRSIKIFCKDKLIQYDDTKDVVHVLNYTYGKKGIVDEIININYTEPLRSAVETFLKFEHNTANRDISYLVTDVFHKIRL